MEITRRTFAGLLTASPAAFANRHKLEVKPKNSLELALFEASKAADELTSSLGRDTNRLRGVTC